MQWLGKGILKGPKKENGKRQIFKYGDVVKAKDIDPKTWEYCKKVGLLGEVPKGIDIDLKKINSDLTRENSTLKTQLKELEIKIEAFESDKDVGISDDGGDVGSSGEGD